MGTFDDTPTIACLTTASSVLFYISHLLFFVLCCGLGRVRSCRVGCIVLTHSFGWGFFWKNKAVSISQCTLRSSCDATRSKNAQIRLYISRQKNRGALGIVNRIGMICKGWHVVGRALTSLARIRKAVGEKQEDIPDPSVREFGSVTEPKVFSALFSRFSRSSVSSALLLSIPGPPLPIAHRMLKSTL